MPHDQPYLEAEKKIEEALKYGAMKLDLSQRFGPKNEEKLAKLPESIGQLTQLTMLNLSSNQLITLPESIGKCINLKELDVSINQLTTLPESLGQLTQLQSLNLSKNQLMTLPDSLGQLTGLWLLDISSNELSALPESLGKLTKLQSLVLSNNKLKILPDSLRNFTQLQYLSLSDNQLTVVPEWVRGLLELDSLKLSNTQLTELPEWLNQLAKLEILDLSKNYFKTIPEIILQLVNLRSLDVSDNQLTILPEWIGQLTKLHSLIADYNLLSDLPNSLVQLENLRELQLRFDIVAERQRRLSWVSFPSDDSSIEDNPLNPELAEAYLQGFDSVKAYLRAKAVGQIILNEAKVILVGEGEVGKTCLMDTLLGKEWQEHPSTHGIEIRPFSATHPDTKKEITLNGWDFGGQRVYRPTHQLFFSAPAVYLVVWKPREGPQQGFVKEWIQLVKRREPSAKILVVATHGGPQQRQPDIDRQELWEVFGKETVVDFFFVDSKPDANGNRKGIAELKRAIARVAAALPEVGRSVPKSFADVRAALQAKGVPYLPLDEVLAICRAHTMDDEIARLFITISHRLGHLTHYENDPALRDIVILRPDWLASAMSYVLDDEQTRTAHGLVKFSRLGQLWDDPKREADTRYPATLHPIFLRLMERFDLSYRVAGLSKNDDSDPVSLIAQLVPDTTPKTEDFEKAWLPELAPGDIQQTQICRIVDAQNGQTANAEGLFFQLIVRLHRYSLGRVKYADSVHWQRGLVLDADYNGRALLRHIGNDVHITVRAAYPQGFLNTLTDEVKYLVESFWEGLRCDVTVPCLATPNCKGLFEVSKLIDNKKRRRPEMPCPICNEWQNIDSLLLNAPAAQPAPADIILSEFAEVKIELAKARQQIMYVGEKTMGRFDRLDDRTRRILSQVDRSYTDLLQVLTDEAKEGPRLFSLVPVDRSSFNPQSWIRNEFKLTLWCEHSRQPLNSPDLNGVNSTKGVYTIELTREWFKKAAPVLKAITSTLSLVLPIASSAVKLVMDESAYKAIENELNFGKDVIDGVLSGAEKTEIFTDAGDSVDLQHGTSLRAENASLRELHALLKAKDPGFGGLVRVLNKRQEFLWVHEKFAGEY